MSSRPKNSNLSDFARWNKIGMEAVQCESWLYALECLSKAVQANPDDRSARKQKHRASRRVHKQTGGPKKAETVKLAAIRSRLMAAEARSDWGTVDHLAEEILARNPWDAGMFAAIARAAQKRQSPDIAEYGWVCAIKIDSTQVKWLRSLGDLLHSLGRYQDAKRCYVQIQQVNPASRGGEELMHAVDVATLLRDGGIHLRRLDAGDRDRNQRSNEPGLNKTNGGGNNQTVQIEQLEELIVQAEQYVQNDQLGQAFELYEKVAKQLPANQSVQDRSEDIHLALLRKRASTAAASATEYPTTDRLAKSAEQHAEKCHQFELRILRQRVDRNSDDLLQTFRLADLCRRTGRLEQAVRLFQKCVGEADLHAESLIGLGECCLKSKQAGTGRRHLEKALTMIDSETRPNSVKLAHYWLGRYFEAAKASPQAMWHYQKVTALDQRFRDVPVRLATLLQLPKAAALDSE